MTAITGPMLSAPAPEARAHQTMHYGVGFAITSEEDTDERAAEPHHRPMPRQATVGSISDRHPRAADGQAVRAVPHRRDRQWGLTRLRRHRRRDRAAALCVPDQ